MKLVLVSGNELVITMKHKSNRFYVRPKADVEAEFNGSEPRHATTIERWIDESSIIELIVNGTKFYTENGGRFTPVIVVNNNIKSVANETLIDNIDSLYQWSGELI